MAEHLTAPADTHLSDRIWTVPNVLSMLRLAGVPVFLYWALVAEHDGRAILLLMAAGASDYFDGMIARRWNSFTRLGQLLDPLADRLYILATLLALVARDGLPLWWALLLIGRDLALTPTIPFLRRHGYGPLPVHFLGKAATFNLLYAFPMLLAALPSNDDLLATVFRPMGWAFAAWGSALYLWSGVLYVVQVRQLVLAEQAEAAAAATATATASAGTAPSGPAPATSAPSGPAPASSPPSGPALSGPALSGPAPSGPALGQAPAAGPPSAPASSPGSPPATATPRPDGPVAPRAGTGTAGR